MYTQYMPEQTVLTQIWSYRKWDLIRDKTVFDSIISIQECMALHCTEPFIISLSSSQYDLCNVARDVKYQTVIIIIPHLAACLGGSVGCTSDWWSGGCGFKPHWVGNILSWRMVMKYFLQSFSPFCWFKKGSCLFLVKECAQYWLTA